jgi:hypothetical protein
MEVQMKNTMKFVAAAAVLFCCTASVRADEVDEVLGWLGKKGAPELCRKGEFREKIISLRSFDGVLCKQTYIAALAEVVCSGPNTEKYSESQCHKHAEAELKGRDPAEVLREAVTKGAGKAREFACGRAGVPEAIKVACSK